MADGDRALLCAVNKYAGTGLDLRGPVMDAARFLKRVLIPLYGFEPADIVTLFDEKCTTGELRTALKWLAEDRRPGSRTFFMFSGHGSEMPNEKARTILCTHDISTNWHNPVTDREVQDVLDTLGNSEFIADACHTGTWAFDNPNINPIGVGGAARSIHRGNRKIRYMPFGMGSPIYSSPATTTVVPTSRNRMNLACGSGAAVFFNETFTNKAQWGACLDEQVAYEFEIDGEPAGLFSHVLEKHLIENKGQPRMELLQSMGHYIQTRYNGSIVQTPTLGTASVNIQKPFFAF